MRKMLTVMAREYKEIVKKKSFLIGSLLTPVIMFAIIFLPTLFIDRETKNPIEFTIVDLGSGLIEQFKQSFIGTLEDGRPLFVVDYITASSEKLNDVKARLHQQIEQDALNFYIVIPQDIIQSGHAERFAKKHGKFIDVETVTGIISKVVIRERLSKYNVPPEEVNTLTRDVQIDYQQVGPEGKEKGKGEFLTQYLSGFVFMMILFISIIGYGQLLLRAVLEEKTSRVIEVLISSLSPFQIMMGKILGLGAASITQLFIWMVFGIVIAFLGSSSALLGGIIANAKGLSLIYFLNFAIFFILGYFLYAALFAMMGSIVNSEREAQQMVAPVNILLILPIMLATAIMQNPDAGWVVALSFVPFLAPTFMILRSSYAFVPASQIIISVLILLATIVIVGWIAARVFRVGILMYGKRPTLPELVKWVRYK